MLVRYLDLYAALIEEEIIVKLKKMISKSSTACLKNIIVVKQEDSRWF